MKNKGISLIVLIITIVVIIILATAIIVNLVQTNIINNAKEATVKQDFKTLQDELNLYIANEYFNTLGKFKVEELNVTDKAEILEIMPSIKNTNYSNYIVVENGKIAISEEMPEPDKTWALEALGEIKVTTNRPVTDTVVPTIPTDLKLIATENSITAVASGSTDDNGLVTYEYSIDNISWQTTGEFKNLESGKEYTIYARASDKSGNKSEIKEEKITTIKLYTSKYYIMEVLGHYRGNSANINELDFYDENGNEIEYSYVDGQVYDTVTGGIPGYWTSTSYFPITGLYDNKVEYAGYTNSTVFLWKYGVGTFGNNTTSWARIMFEMEDGKNVKSIKVCVGDEEYTGTSSNGGRTPQSVSIYEVNEYNDSTYANNIKQRNDEGLTLINTISFSKEYVEPVWFSFTE